MTKKSLAIKGGILAIIIIAVVVLIGTTDVLQYANGDALAQFIKQFGIWAPLVYGILYTIGVVLLVPATVFTVAAGLLFGTLTGSILVVTAATAAASIAFLIGRFFGKEAVEKLAGKHGVGKWIKKLDDLIGKHQFQSIVLIRCLFLPYIAVSYAAGAVPKASFWSFFWATLLTNIVISTMFVYLGSNLLNGPRALILPVILVALVLLIPKITKKLTKKDINVE